MAGRLPPKFIRLKNSPAIYYQVDRSRRVSTGLKDAKAAELYAWQADWERIEAERIGPKDGWSSAQFYPEFLEDKKLARRKGRPLSPSTFNNYERAVSHLSSETWWRCRPLKEITTEVAKSYIKKYRESDGYTDPKFDPERDIRFMKQLKKWAIDNNHIRGDLIRVSTPVGCDKINPVGRCLSDDEINKLVTAVLESRSRTAKVQFGMGLYMGMRNQEIKKTCRSWIDFDKHFIGIPAEFTKTREYREVPIHAKVREGLLALSRDKRGEDPLFSEVPVSPLKRCQITGWWPKVKERAEVKCRFHDLRVTCATKMANAGIAESVSQDILGHDDEVHLIYVKVLSRTTKYEALNTVDWTTGNTNLHTNLHTIAYKSAQNDASPCNSMQNDNSCASKECRVINQLQPVDFLSKAERWPSG